MGMPIESCWYCGDAAEWVVSGRPICGCCRERLKREFRRKVVEALMGVAFFVVLLLTMGMVMVMTDQNWVPIR